MIVNPALKPLLDEWAWQAEGLCRGYDGRGDTPFYHPRGERGKERKRREDRAKAICGTCPVLERCRRHALETKQDFGTWGGMSERERRELLAAARKNPALLTALTA